MIICQIQYFGVRARSWVRLPKAYYFWLPQNPTKKRPKYAGPIYFHADVYFRDDFRNCPKIQRKRPKYAGPICFHADVYFRDDFRDRPKIQQKRPIYAGPIYFQRMYISEMILEIAPKSNKTGPIMPARFISTRMYKERIFVPVFTNFAATLAWQPSAASLAPRSKKRVKLLKSLSWCHKRWKDVHINTDTSSFGLKFLVNIS